MDIRSLRSAIVLTSDHKPVQSLTLGVPSGRTTEANLALARRADGSYWFTKQSFTCQLIFMTQLIKKSVKMQQIPGAKRPRAKMEIVKFEFC